MHDQLSRLRSNALAIAVLAVVIIASTSAGSTASRLITGGQIKDHSITGKDIKLHSIGSGNLKTGISSFGVPDAGATKGSTGPTGAAGAPGASDFWHASSAAGLNNMTSTFVEVPGGKVGFTTVAARTSIEITFNALCMTAHGANATVEIVVDGSVHYPIANQVDCSKDSTPPITALLGTDIGPGDHTVLANFKDENGGTGAFLHHTYLSVKAFTP